MPRRRLRFLCALGAVVLLSGGAPAPLVSGARADDYPEGRLRQIAAGRYWHLLLHYQGNLFGGYTSRADGAPFFFSPEGVHDPLAELKATLKAFTENDRRVGPLQLPPQCAFMERYHYLKSELSLRLPEVRCEEYEKWRAQLNPESATLVFASAFLGNSASMFGHTFLRIDSKPRSARKSKLDLLDYGLSYGASQMDNNPVLLAVKGLFGGYVGALSFLPYYQKVKEYNDSESRDLWEYKLNLDEAQIERILRHVWELGNTYFDYFFFDENCSYMILRLLEIGNPDWHLTDRFFWWVIPADTVRVVAKIPGAVTRVTFRPSLYRRLKERVLSFSGAERDEFERSRYPKLALDGHETAYVLDALIEEHQYALQKTAVAETDETKERARRLAIARARTEEAPHPVVPPAPATPPDSGNDSRKLSLYGGNKHGNPYLGIQFRPVFHDLYDDDDGYHKFSEVNIMRTDLRYVPYLDKFKAQEVELLEVESYPPVDTISRAMSWVGRAGLYSPQDLVCRECVAGRGQIGLGYSAYQNQEREDFLVYALVKGQLETSGWFDHGLRVGPSLTAGLVTSRNPKAKGFKSLKAGVNGEVFYYPTQDPSRRDYGRFTLLVSANLVKDLEVRIEADEYLTPTMNFVDYTGTLGWYF